MARIFNPPHPGGILVEQLKYLGIGTEDFARQIDLCPSSFNRILEEKELVKRVNSSNGRQIYKIVVTEKGRNLREIIHPVIVDIRKTITKGISKEELEICLQILEKMLDNMKDKVKLQI